MRHNISINTPESLEITSDGERAVVKARVLCAGIFTSGIDEQTFKITNDDLIKIKSKYNGQLLDFVSRMFKKKLTEYELQSVQMAPICLEHEVEDMYIVGRIIGKLWIEEDPLTQKVWLWANLEILGAENIKKIQDGRRKAISINFNTKTHELTEISFTAYGAVQDACVMSAISKVNKINNKNSNDDIILLVNKLNTIDTSIDEKYSKISELRNEINLLDKRVTFTNKLQRLVKSCRLTKASMKEIINSVSDSTTEETLTTINAVLSKLPKCIDTKKHKYNINDSQFREYLMSDKNLTQQEVWAQLNGKNTQAQFSKGVPDLENKIKHEEHHSDGDEHEVKLSHEHIEKLKEMIKQGKHEEAHKFLCGLSKKEDEVEDDTDSKNGVELKKLKEEKELTLKKYEEDLENEKKEKVKLKAELDETNARLSALTTGLVLTKYDNDKIKLQSELDGINAKLSKLTNSLENINKPSQGDQ